MATSETNPEKTIVQSLDYTAKTAKRVTWEAWEFTITGPHQVQVTNASYGHQKDDHQYTVGIAERNGVAIPAECSCPADIHRDDDCKHKLALASVATSLVLNAAVDYPSTSSASEDEHSEKTDDACLNGDEECSGPDGEDLPCFECYQSSETEN